MPECKVNGELELPKLRILVVAPHAFYIDRGSPIDVDILVRALSNRGHHVDLLVYDEGEDRTYPNLTIQRAGAPRWLGAIGPGFSWKKLVSDAYLFRHAYNLVRSRHYDVIHAGEEAVFIAMFLKGRFRLPYVYDLDSSLAQQLVEKMPKLFFFRKTFEWFERQAVRGAVACAPVCDALGDLVRQLGARYTEVLYDISLLDIDQPVEPAGVCQQHGITDPVFLYVGNLEPYQGIDLLLEGHAVARRLGARAHLVIAGGTDRAIGAYQLRAKALGIDHCTLFLGRWPAAKLASLLQDATVLVAPRIRGINTPMKVFPYLHSGKPVLVTKLPTHTQILNESVAYLADPTPEAFGAAIARLASDPALRQSLGEAGREFVSRSHTFVAHQQRVDRLYEYVTGHL